MSARQPDSAIARLYDEVGHLVLRRCMKMMGEPQAAMDVAQWTFMRAIETGFEVRTRPEALSWLYRTATQRCLHQLRHTRTRTRLHEVHHDALATLPRAGPEAAVADRELIAKVLAEVDDRTGQIALMTWAQGLSNARVAEICGVSVRTVGRARAEFEQRVRSLTEEAS